MVRTEEFLRLAQTASDAKSAAFLSGAALITAIAHLAHGVEARLVNTIASAKAENGEKPTKQNVWSEVPRALPARMKKLGLASNYVLDDGKSPTQRVLAAIGLRNRLVHELGSSIFGSADELDSSINGTILTIRVRLPLDPWDEITLPTTLQLVEDLKCYFKEVDRISVSSESTTSLLFHSSSRKE